MNDRTIVKMRLGVAAALLATAGTVLQGQTLDDFRALPWEGMLEVGEEEQIEGDPWRFLGYAYEVYGDLSSPSDVAGFSPGFRHGNTRYDIYSVVLAYHPSRDAPGLLVSVIGYPWSDGAWGGAQWPMVPAGTTLQLGNHMFRFDDAEVDEENWGWGYYLWWDVHPDPAWGVGDTVTVRIAAPATVPVLPPAGLVVLAVLLGAVRAWRRRR